ncbi:hypothetical protein N0M98_32055 [Paenibacillus doosanensis]|uniref:Uncharacterized protein n=1 Tax=Paenibacillus konkukensis TaxID=2020716 RepID=A0ABY4RU53_9BACL|nr:MULTISPECIES: hypothetical protein [Paenibacillus]MCS7464733.1 hypothetical protein [Paenibacillus doosanensis]UQZ85033.1 hypothetical protein SK3146_04316 [Paenibacillus konkukensis]
MNRIPGMMKMHIRAKWTSLLFPWVILFTSFIINLFISYLINNQEPFYTGGLASIFFSMPVIGAVTLAHTFPFALGFCVRRRDYFLGTALAAVITNTITAVLLCLLSLVESATDGWGVRMHFFNVPFINQFGPLGHLIIYLVLLLHLYFLGFAVSSLHRRFGPGGLFMFLAAALILLSASALLLTHYRLWGPFALGFSAHFNLIVGCMALAILLYAFLSYALLRRATD